MTLKTEQAHALLFIFTCWEFANHILAIEKHRKVKKVQNEMYLNRSVLFVVFTAGNRANQWLYLRIESVGPKSLAAYDFS